MIDRMRPTTAVLLPGTGSDADFVLRAFGPPLRSRGLDVVAVVPETSGVVAGYLRVLDETSGGGPIVAAGVSLGAAVAVNWAATAGDAAAFVLAALPPWTGAAADAPAAISARTTAAALRTDGLDAVTAAMRAGSPEWLGTELARSWRSQWPGLPDALEEAAGYHAPTPADLSGVRCAVGIATATDDFVHPTAVAETWAQHLPRAGIGRLTLADIAADPAALGLACLRGLDAG